MILASGLFFLSGCSKPGQSKKDFLAAKDICRAKYPQRVGNFYKLALCIDGAEFNYTAESPVDFQEAVDRAAARDALAKQQDAGQISSEEAQLTFGKAAARAQASAIATSNANRARAAAAMLQSGAYQLHPYQAPIYPDIMNFHPFQTQTPVNCTSNAIGQTLYTNCR